MPATIQGNQRLTASGTASVLEERRSGERLSTNVPAKLRGAGCSQEVSCTATDISEGGVYVHVPLDIGIDVGQRFEVVLSGAAHVSNLASALDEGCFATVVRTDRAVENSVPLLGAGLRFDQPLMV